ncbi:uncharacterized protein LOC144446891 [Glandiceps talaboti]
MTNQRKILQVFCIWWAMCGLSSTRPMPTNNIKCGDKCQAYHVLSKDGSVLHHEAVQVYSKYKEKRPGRDIDLEVSSLPSMMSIYQRRNLSETDLLLWHKENLISYRHHFRQLKKEESKVTNSFQKDFQNIVVLCKRTIAKVNTLLCGKQYTRPTTINAPKSPKYGVNQAVEECLRNYRQRKILERSNLSKVQSPEAP